DQQSISVSSLSLHDALPILAGPSTRVVHLGGWTLMPGFHDAHLHLTAHGRALEQLDLATSATLEDALARVAERAARLAADEWLRSEEHTSELQSRENLVCRL